MKKASKFTIERAKRTIFGRVVCRLFGDQTGQAMMEYVVIGVLIVAAAVAMVVVFGENIQKSFQYMVNAIRGKHSTNATLIPADDTTAQGRIITATAEGTTTRGAE